MDFDKFIYFNVDDNKVVQSFDELTDTTRMIRIHRFNGHNMHKIILSVIRDKLYIHTLPSHVDSKSTYVPTLQSMNAQLVVVGYIPHEEPITVFTR